VKKDDPRPPSRQIADDLRDQVTSGRLPLGARLPSGRALARQYGVALMTAQSAVQRLKDEGLVYSTGQGNFVVDEAHERGTDCATLAKDLAATKAEVRELRDRVAALEARD